MPACNKLHCLARSFIIYMMKRSTKTALIIIPILMLLSCCLISGISFYFYQIKQDIDNKYRSYPLTLSAFQTDERSRLLSEYNDLEDQRSSAWFEGNNTKIIELNEKAKTIEIKLDYLDSKTSGDLDKKRDKVDAFRRSIEKLPGGLARNIPGISDDRAIGIKIANAFVDENDLETKLLDMLQKRTLLLTDLDQAYKDSANGKLDIPGFSKARNNVLEELEKMTKQEEKQVKLISQKSEDIRSLWAEYK